MNPSLPSRLVPQPGDYYIGTGPYGEQEWVQVKEVRDPLEHESKKPRVVYDVLDGSEEGRTIAYPLDQFVREFVPDV